MPAEPEHDADGGEDQQDDGGGQRRAGREPAPRRPEGPLDMLAIGDGGDRLIGEGLDGADAVQALIALGRGLADLLVHRARQAAHLPAEDDDGDHHQRHDDGGDAGELRAGGEEQTTAAQEHHPIAHGKGQRGADHRLQHRRIGGEARDDVAGARHLVEIRRQGHEVAEDLLAQIRHHPLADPAHEIESREAGKRQHHGRGEDDEHRLVQQPRIAGAEALVDQIFEALAEGQHHAGGNRHGQQRAERPASDRGPAGR